MNANQKKIMFLEMILIGLVLFASLHGFILKAIKT